MIKRPAHRRGSKPASTSMTSMRSGFPGSASTGSRRARNPYGDPISVQPEAVRVWLRAEALWALLSQLGISQNELARRAGITGAYLSQLANRKRSPSIRTVRRLLNALEGASFSDIFVFECLDEG